MKFLNQFFHNFFLIYRKMYQTLSAIYYQKNKEKTTKKACKRYQNPSTEEK